MIPVYQICRAYCEALEKAATMPKAPTPSRKGIPIGLYAVETDATGKTKLKPKRKARSTPQEIAARKRKKWRAAK
jgi:hypothetical protein